jgi:hypothetical protein
MVKVAINSGIMTKMLVIHCCRWANCSRRKITALSFFKHGVLDEISVKLHCLSGCIILCHVHSDSRINGIYFVTYQAK